MESLYTVANEFAELFDSYESISDMEFTTDGKGGFLNDDGDPVDPDEVKAEMQQAWFDTLDAMECEITDKVKNIALYIKNLEADADAIGTEIKKLQKRKTAKTDKADRLYKYLAVCLEKVNRNTIETPQVVVKLGRPSERLEVTDTKSFLLWAQNTEHEDCLRYKDPEINKMQVKQLIHNGEIVPYVHISTNRSVSVR